MSFPWWESSVPVAYRATFPQKLEAMLVAEARRRAEILHSLGYTFAETLLRVRAYLRWDYETGGRPRAAAGALGAVDAVYGRRTRQAELVPTPALAKAAAAKVPAPVAKNASRKAKAPARKKADRG